MPQSDKTLGTVYLILSISLLLYLFLVLMLMPILPIDNVFELSPVIISPDIILIICGLFGFVFMGSLSIFTLVVLYK